MLLTYEARSVTVPDYAIAEEQGRTADHLSADSRTSAQLVQHYRNENTGESHKDRIRQMVDSGGWAEADAVVVELGLWRVADGIGLAVLDRRSVAAAIYHGVEAPIARVGLQMASTATDLFLPARGLPKIGLYLRPSAEAIERRKRDGLGATATMCVPFTLDD